MLAKIDPAVAKNTLIFPTPEMLASCTSSTQAALNNEDYMTAVAEADLGA